MAEIVIHRESLDLQVYLDKIGHEVNSYTFASILVNLTDAIKAVNRHINPGFDVEVIVLALDEGSFKAFLQTIYKSTKNLFSNQIVQTIVLGIVTNLIYDQFFSHKPEKPDIRIEVTSDAVIISSGNDRVLVSKDVFEGKKKVEDLEEVRRPILKTLDTIRLDKSIDGFGVSDSLHEKPKILIDREILDRIAPETYLNEEQNQRIVSERCTIEILRAIMRKSTRKWEFVWHGTEISAPITDEEFYRKFSAHKIKIAPGDTFDVELRIVQQKHPGTEIFVNKSYEVVTVFDHSTPPEKNLELVVSGDDPGQTGTVADDLAPGQLTKERQERLRKIPPAIKLSKKKRGDSE